MANAPVILFVYNRPHHTQQTLEALAKNTLASESDLIVFCDGNKGEEDRHEVEEVRKIVHSAAGFKSVRIEESNSNNGLANSIIKGVTAMIQEYGKVIVLEDDLVTAPYFLTFMNEALDKFEHNDKIGHIQGYAYPVPEFPETFLTQWIGSWGWATWKRAWQYFNPDGKALMNELKERKLSKTFDFNGNYPYTRMLQRQIDGENNSWAIRWYASLFLKGMLSLNAGKSLVQNIGFDNTGTHCNDEDIYRTPLYTGTLQISEPDTNSENVAARKLIEQFHARTFSFQAKAKRRIKRFLNIK